MSHSFVTAAVALLGASQAAAHMIMATPVPFGTPDNSPLSSSGSNFPCKLSGSPETFYSRSSATNNTMAVGETQTLSFTGSAVHGGGSCQLAITSDLQPSSSTTWQVIQSIEGGCPTKDGNGPSTYDYSIPDSVAAGEYVFAWTWISKESGAPEYYMNCAPITVTASTTKRDDELLVRDDSTTLPNLFVANLDSINSCKTTTGTDPLYPDPGPNVSKPSTMTTNYQSPSGTDCFPLGASSNSSESGSDSSTSASSATSATSASSVATVESATTKATTTSASTATTSASAGGVFATVSTASAASTAEVTATTSSTTASSVSATPVSTAGTNSTSTTGGSTLSGSCTNEGIFNCVGGTQYQQCASGSWTTLQDMPSGTTCTIGESSTLWSRAWGGRRMRRVRRIL